MSPLVPGAGRPFRYAFNGMEIFFGENCLFSLAAHLDILGLSRALVVTGSNVGRNAEAMGPVQAALGGRLVAVFDGTEPTKGLASSVAGVGAMEESGADVLIALGSGSSLDTARLMSLLQANTVPLEELVSQRDGVLVKIPEPDKARIPVVVVPTTFAGADLSDIAIAELTPGLKPPGHKGIMRIWGQAAPIAAVYDPLLFASTPLSVMLGSCVNGFSKGMETLWSRKGNGITDSTASRGLRLMRNAVPGLPEKDPASLTAAVEGLILVQYGRQLSVIHAVGHAFSRRYPVQQGLVHGVSLPQVARFVFERTDARRELVASALLPRRQSASGEDIAENIVAELDEIRRILGFPRALNEHLLDAEVDFSMLAMAVASDALSPLADGPEGFDPSLEELEALVSRVWYG